MRTINCFHLLVSIPGFRVSDDIVVRRNAAAPQVEVRPCGMVDNFVGSVMWESHDRYVVCRAEVVLTEES